MVSTRCSSFPPLHSDPVQHSNAELESTVRRLIEGIILEKDEFDVRDALPNVVPDPSSLQLDSEYSCPVGKVRWRAALSLGVLWCAVFLEWI